MPPKKRTAATAKLERELSTLSPEALREELRLFGENAGPIDDSNKEIYVRQLARKKLKCETEDTVQTSSLSPSTSISLSSSANLSSLSWSSISPTAGKGLGRKPLSDSSTHSPGSSVLGATKVMPTLKSRLQAAAPDNSPALLQPVATGTKAVASSARSKKSSRKAPQSSDKQAIRKFQIEGLTAATFTPFKEDGELNLSVIGSYANWLVTNEVKAVFVNGTTGESLSLTVEERKILAQEWIKVAATKLKVIVHVGTENLKYTRELAQHAQSSGAVAIGVMPPTFFKPATIDHLILYLQKVASAAPSLPMYYYHIPSMTGVKFSMEEFLDAASSSLPTLRGIKYTSPELFEFGRCVTTQGSKYQVIYGADEQLIGALALGGTAAIGSTYNYAGKLYNRLISAYQRKDTDAAKLEQRRSQAMVKLLFKYGAHAGGGKAFMKLVGVDCGPPRLPVQPLTPESIKNLESDLRDIGFFEWA